MNTKEDMFAKNFKDVFTYGLAAKLSATIRGLFSPSFLTREEAKQQILWHKAHPQQILTQESKSTISIGSSRLSLFAAPQKPVAAAQPEQEANKTQDISNKKPG